MSNQEFGTGGDSAQDEGKNFGQAEGGKTNTGEGTQGIDPVEYEALRKRDEAAQAHIAKLESENAEARDKVTELEKSLTSATTIDEALARIANQGEGQGQQSIDPTDVAQVVREVLGQEQTKSKQETNWSNVQSTLNKEFGDWETADRKIMERCSELDLTPAEATQMAKNSPKAFMDLFVPKAQAATSAKPGSSTGTGEMGQRGVAPSGTEVRDKAYYQNLRRTNPNKYWSIETQAQYRRDLFSDQ